MSYRSIHTQFPIDGVRDFKLAANTEEILRKISWEELKEKKVQLYGNTHWNDLEIVAFFLKNKLMAPAAAKEIGYKSPSTSGADCITRRLMRVNSKNILTFIFLLMKVGKIPKDFHDLLNPKRYGKKGRHSHRKVRVHYSKLIITAGIMKNGSRQGVAKAFKIPMEFVNYWLDK